MPTAQRRQKQRQARARAEATAAANEAAAAASASVATATPPPGRQDSQQLRSKTTQTPLDPYTIEELIRRYWNMLDRKGLDQTSQPFQFIVASYSAQSSVAPAGASSQSDYQDYDYESYEEYNEYGCFESDGDELPVVCSQSHLPHDHAEASADVEKAPSIAVCDLSALD